MASDAGGAKKFLYTGPKSRDVEENEDLPWNFTSKTSSPRGTSNMNSNPMTTKFGMEDVWSIKKDVNVGNRQQKSDGLTFNTSKNYYSRYGGMKDKEGGTADTGSNLNSLQHGNVGASWNMTSARRPFSYSFNSDPKQQTGAPVSPRNVSNSSFSHYTGAGNSFSGNNNNNPTFDSKYKSPW